PRRGTVCRTNGNLSGESYPFVIQWAADCCSVCDELSSECRSGLEPLAYTSPGRRNKCGICEKVQKTQRNRRKAEIENHFSKAAAERGRRKKALAPQSAGSIAIREGAPDRLARTFVGLSSCL